MVTAEQIRDELDHCQHPVFLFDDDVDGLCAFLLLYRYKREGHGVPVKTAGGIRENFVDRTLDADKVFLLDTAEVHDSFLDKVAKKIIWIDHHPPRQTKALLYNPLLTDPLAKKPTSLLCHEIVQQDSWIALVGTVGDWVYDKELAASVRKEYPDLLPSSIRTPAKALFESDAGKLAKIMNFLLKGRMKDIKTGMKILTRVTSPYEILHQTTPQGKWLWKRYQALNTPYEELFLKAKEDAAGAMVVFTYQGDLSFTSELSNELLYTFPKKVIIVAREKSGEMRLSIRYAGDIRTPLLAALAQVGGRGGGHREACGASLPKKEWKKFLEIIETSTH